jgi:hypothetical protein
MRVWVREARPTGPWTRIVALEDVVIENHKRDEERKENRTATPGWQGQAATGMDEHCDAEETRESFY